MVYEMFQTKIADTLQSSLGSDYELMLQKVPKNNGTLLDSLSYHLSQQLLRAVSGGNPIQFHCQGDSSNLSG